MAKPFSPHEDDLAALLAEVNYSNRQIAQFLGRTDKSVAAAIERAKSRKPRFTARQKKKAQALLRFQQWLDEGEQNGYLESLVAMLEHQGLET